jgi:hypothetical protein
VDFRLDWHGDPEQLLVSATGVADPDGLDAWLEAVLADPRWQPPMRVLIDYRLLDWGQMTAAEIEERVEVIARQADRIGASRVALVTDRKLDFGLLRMEEAQLEGRMRYEVGIFRSTEEARAWLTESAPSAG